MTLFDAMLSKYTCYIVRNRVWMPQASLHESLQDSKAFAIAKEIANALERTNKFSSRRRLQNERVRRHLRQAH